MKYATVDWGDGWFVYCDGKYIGKDDQVDPWEMLIDAGLLEEWHLISPEEFYFAEREFKDYSLDEIAPGRYD